MAERFSGPQREIWRPQIPNFQALGSTLLEARKRLILMTIGSLLLDEHRPQQDTILPKISHANRG